MTGTVSILNVGAGDITLSFDNKNPSETLRAGRVIRDCLRRGYALLVEVERDGENRFERAVDFDETRNVYIIADFDPVTAALADKSAESERQLDEAIMYRQQEQEAQKNVKVEDVAEGQASDVAAAVQPGAESVKPVRRGRPRKEVPASGTRAVAVGRSAGG